MAKKSDLIYKDMVNKDLAYPGIYMAELMQDINGKIKVYVPSVMNRPTTVSELESLPEAVWCAYNLESCDIANAEKPMWVMFEAGDVKRPVIVSYTVIGGAEGSSGSNTGSSSTTSATYTSVSGGNWITKWTCTVYGGEGDDNGICGWNGINYNTISGCHVAIPMSCITGTDSNFPEFSRGYGTVLEVRNPDNGNTVVAVVADCGNFGPNGTYNNTAALDLPPNTQRALGIFTSHSIEYRVIGYIDSWNGEQLSLSDFVTNTTSSSGATNIVTEAQKYLGVPYVWGGSSPNGFDCSGLVQYVYAQCGKNIPRVAADQYHQSNKVSRDQLQPGDLVFFTGSNGSSSNPGHVGIYIGNNEFIHSPSSGKTITITSLDNSYYSSTYVGAGRY